MPYPHSYDNLENNIHQDPQSNFLETDKNQQETAIALAKSLSKNDFSFSSKVLQQILQTLEQLDLEKDVYAMGFQSKVYKIGVEYKPGQKKYFLILKNRSSAIKRGVSYIEEYGFHAKANKLLKENPQISKHIDTPRIWSITNDGHGNHYLIMDFIEGETVFKANCRLAIPIILSALEKENKDIYNSLFKTQSELQSLSDNDVKKYICTLLIATHRYLIHTDFIENNLPLSKSGDFDLNTNNNKRLEEKINRICNKIIEKNYQSVHYGIDSLKDAAKSYVELLHSNDIYHNDMTSRNIILGEDGKIYILDFGNATNHMKSTSALRKATESPSSIMKGGKYEEYTGDFKLQKHINILQYLHDRKE